MTVSVFRYSLLDNQNLILDDSPIVGRDRADRAKNIPGF